MNPRQSTVFIALLLLGTSLLLPACKQKEAAQAQNGPPPPVMAEGVIASTSILDNTIYSTGSILANEEVDIRSEISGRVVSINFTEGTRVSQGQLLVKIDDSELQAELKKLELQEALAVEDVFRKSKLREIDAISQEDLDIAANKLGALRADIQNVRSRIRKTELRAPFSGRIGLRHVSPGAYINSSTLIARLQDINSVKIEFTIPEKYFTQIRNGLMIAFSVEGTDSLFRGVVYAIEPKVDPSTRSVSLRAKSSNQGKLLVPGSFARVEITLDRILDAISLPSEAIIPDIKGEKVLLSKNGIVKTQYIETGLRTDREVEVIKGLDPGDTVITSGLLQLREGVSVTIRIGER